MAEAASKTQREIAMTARVPEPNLTKIKAPCGVLRDDPAVGRAGLCPNRAPGTSAATQRPAGQVLRNPNGWGEPRLGGSPRSISGSLAAPRGALKNKG